MDHNLIGRTLQLMSRLFMSALVATHMRNRQYLMGLLMIEGPSLRLRIMCLSAAAKHQHQEEVERIRKEARDTHSAKEYAQSMMEWGRMTQIHHENKQKFIKVRSNIYAPCMFCSCYCSWLLSYCITLDYRMWLHTLECLPMQFLLLFHLPQCLRHIVFQHHQIYLMLM
jgi:hypothetical protein